MKSDYHSNRIQIVIQVEIQIVTQIGIQFVIHVGIQFVIHIAIEFITKNISFNKYRYSFQIKFVNACCIFQWLIPIGIGCQICININFKI